MVVAAHAAEAVLRKKQQWAKTDAGEGRGSSRGASSAHCFSCLLLLLAPKSDLRLALTGDPPHADTPLWERSSDYDARRLADMREWGCLLTVMR